MKVVWNSEAIKNLRTIRDHYRQFSPDAAIKVTEGIVNASRKLQDFPKIGRIVPEIADPLFREVIWADWRIIYMLPIGESERIEILNIIHSRKQFGGLE